ncbi:MAG TPA: DUF2975 domain-containing protein [Gammaproteobacteria bacterium]|jgi:hypothetical protein|nr:DUF2975 domain-containing protein [Gammaproteobacteria bacterium]
MNKIKRVSRFFRIIFQIDFLWMLIAFALSWVNAPQEFVALHGFMHFNPIPPAYINLIMHPLTISEKFSAITISAVPLAVDLFIVYTLIKLFRLYESGVIFSLQVVKRLRNIGFGLLLGQIINPFYQLAMGYVLTVHNPPGYGKMSVTLDQTNIGILLTSLLIILISWIMIEGCKLSDEQQLTI